MGVGAPLRIWAWFKGEREGFRGWRRQVVAMTTSDDGEPRLWCLNDRGGLFDPMYASNFDYFEEGDPIQIIAAQPGWFVEGRDEGEQWRLPVIAWRYDSTTPGSLEALCPPDDEGYTESIQAGKGVRYVYEDPRQTAEPS